MLKILEAVRKVNPDVKFLFENVKMKTIFQDFLTNLIGVEPILLNSSLLSAQNRERLYWTNIDKVIPPKDLGLAMDDILEKVQVRILQERPQAMLPTSISKSMRLKDEFILRTINHLH